MISVRKLTKHYGRTVAVDDVSFEIGAHAVVGFLGPNGAGKSTTLRMLAGFLAPTSGSVQIAGFDIEADALQAKARLGYMAETVPLYPELRVIEYLRFRAELKGVPRTLRKKAIAEALERGGATEVADTLIGHLSKGYRQRVGLADALVANPPVIVLDEPTAGLDPNQIRDVRNVVREIGKDHVVLLSTHILSEVEATCDRVLVIGKGKLLADEPTTKLRSLSAARGALVTVRADSAQASQAVRGVPAVASIEVRSEAEGLVVLACAFAAGAEPGAAVEAVVDAFATAGLKVREVKAVGGGLEEVFAELTR